MEVQTKWYERRAMCMGSDCVNSFSLFEGRYNMRFMFMCVLFILYTLYYLRALAPTP